LILSIDVLNKNHTELFCQWLKSIKRSISEPGKHRLKYGMVNPAVVSKKLVIDFGTNKQSYPGPYETRYKK
jgi:Gylcosyl hydrolase family 115 C-terminal domain